MSASSPTPTVTRPEPKRIPNPWLALRRNGYSLLLVALLIAFDQGTKLAVTTMLKPLPPQFFLGGLLELVYSENTGTFLSLGAGLSPEVRFWVLVVMVGAFLIALQIWVLFSRLRAVNVIAVSLIVAGGASNCLDRFLHAGSAAVDFMIVGVGGLHTGVFNFADLILESGLVILILANRERAKTDRAS
jgi:signal peptidase II